MDFSLQDGAVWAFTWFLNALRISYNDKIKELYSLLIKDDSLSGKLTVEQFEKFYTAAKEDYLKTSGRILTGKNREKFKEILEAEKLGIIYTKKLVTKDGINMESWLESLEEVYGVVEYSVKRVGQFEDPPFIPIN
jgi:hypothetical protein